MSKNITSSDCKSMFADRFSALSMKEIGIELKHYSVGTAPESPSFLVNQDELRRTIIDKFSTFFDPERSQGLEIMFLKSNYGNGKSHFIRSISSFFQRFDNVICKSVSLKREETDLKKRVLEAVNQKTILECARYYVSEAKNSAAFDSKEGIVQELQERNDINISVANLIYSAAEGSSMTEQIQAVSILKGNYLAEYKKTFKITSADLNSDFYFSVILLLAKYLSIKGMYIVIVFDEYEHVCSWKNSSARAQLYLDLKSFYDGIESYSNLCFIFAESASVEADDENFLDPAFVTRKRNTTYQIADISSDEDIKNLFNCILKRYEKYYEVDFSVYREDIFEDIISETRDGGNSNYRSYTAAIIKVLNEYKNNPRKKKRSTNNETLSIKKQWELATSISKKTMICSALEKVIKNSANIVINSGSKKYGEYVIAGKNSNKLMISIVVTDNPSIRDFEKRREKTLGKGSANDCNTIIYMYPCLDIPLDILSNEYCYYYTKEVLLDLLEKVEADLSGSITIKEFFNSFTVAGRI